MLTKKVAIGAVIAAVLVIGAGVYYIYGPSGIRDVGEQIERAQAQVEQHDYSAGLAAYSEIVKAHPHNKAARQGMLDTAMSWIRDYHVLGSNDKEIAATANRDLTPLMSRLEEGLVGASGKRAADLTAHIGWARFLKAKMGESEVEESAEPYFRRALSLDGKNVFANTMLGNWLLQVKPSRGAKEALSCFQTAVASGEEREWVRSFELGGWMSSHTPTSERELARLANEMRKNGEPIDAEEKHRILAIYTPTLGSPAELANVLTASPPEESWATYVWLDAGPESSDPEWQELKHTFVLANIDELAGRKEAALSLYQRLAQNHLVEESNLAPRVQEGIQRLQIGPKR